MMPGFANPNISQPSIGPTKPTKPSIGQVPWLTPQLWGFRHPLEKQCPGREATKSWAVATKINQRTWGSKLRARKWYTKLVTWRMFYFNIQQFEAHPNLLNYSKEEQRDSELFPYSTVFASWLGIHQDLSSTHAWMESQTCDGPGSSSHLASL